MPNGIILKINFVIAKDSALARKPRENEAFPRALGGGIGHCPSVFVIRSGA
jgi:hypothetical protein